MLHGDPKGNKFSLVPSYASAALSLDPPRNLTSISPIGGAWPLGPHGSSSSHHPRCAAFAAGTMWPHCLFLFLLFHKTWAEAETSCFPSEETQFFQFFFTMLLDNISSTELTGMATLADLPIIVLDPHTWSLNICWPWVQEVTADSEVKKLLSFSMIVIRNAIRFLHEMVTKAGLDYPLIFQIHAGCKLYANGTRWSFVNAGEGGRDLVTYKINRELWLPQTSTPLAKLISKTLTDNRAVSGLLEDILSSPIPNFILMLHQKGRKDLERQVPPIAVVFARTAGPAQLLLVCRVTSFYPRPITVTWLRDGRELPPSPALSTSTVLPNADLTYQLRSTLLVSPQDGHSYACRVQHCSLGDRSLLVPWENPSGSSAVGVTITVLFLIAIIIGGVWWWRRRKLTGSGRDSRMFLI
uniref:T-cell surface glycoprotein CD1b-3-like n=3 Tax=Coturnix japonica TaxID=93934 RepID=A0A8C2TWB5_COTJA